MTDCTIGDFRIAHGYSGYDDGFPRINSCFDRGYSGGSYLRFDRNLSFGITYPSLDEPFPTEAQRTLHSSRRPRLEWSLGNSVSLQPQAHPWTSFSRSS